MVDNDITFSEDIPNDAHVLIPISHGQKYFSKQYFALIADALSKQPNIRKVTFELMHHLYHNTVLGLKGQFVVATDAQKRDAKQQTSNMASSWERSVEKSLVFLRRHIEVDVRHGEEFLEGEKASGYQATLNELKQKDSTFRDILDDTSAYFAAHVLFNQFKSKANHNKIRLLLRIFSDLVPAQGRYLNGDLMLLLYAEEMGVDGIMYPEDIPWPAAYFLEHYSSLLPTFKYIKINIEGMLMVGNNLQQFSKTKRSVKINEGSLVTLLEDNVSKEIIIYTLCRVLEKSQNDTAVLEYTVIQDLRGVLEKLPFYPKGAEVKTFSAKVTPLSLSLSKDDALVVKLLLRLGADLNPSDPEVIPPLIYAILAEKIALTNLLIKHNARVNSDWKGMPVLAWAMLGMQEEIFKILLNKGIRLNKRFTPLPILVPQPTSYYPIHFAAHIGNVEAVKWLLIEKAEMPVRFLPTTSKCYAGQTTVTVLISINLTPGDVAELNQIDVLIIFGIWFVERSVMFESHGVHLVFTGVNAISGGIKGPA